MRIPLDAGAPVRDPATGVVGRIRDARLNWRDGRQFLLLTLEVDDDSAVAAALRDGPVF